MQMKDQILDTEHQQ